MSTGLSGADERPATLEAWLERIEGLHPQSIAMGLERVRHVRGTLGLEPAFPVITVGGTNGKGSVCALLEAILDAAGYRVGCYTSPHLLRYNERVRIGRREASDADLVAAFRDVEAARGGTPLTYFEFGTLAAMRLFVERRVDAAILEVGLGGRLDAVNVFDADCAVVAAVDLDHMEYLGTDRESIAFEKAGIFRPGRPAVCSDRAPPQSLIAHAQAIGARLLRIGVDFDATPQAGQWLYRGPGGRRTLPHPALRGGGQLDNAAAAITALDSLRSRLPVGMGDVRTGLLRAEAPGRFQVLPGRPVVVLDVAHNPQAARTLAASLTAMGGRFGRTLAVFSMLRDKDVAGVIAAMSAAIDHWFVCGLGGLRGAEVDALEGALHARGIRAATRCADVADAYAQACDMAGETDRIVVFGSFYTVAGVMRVRASRDA